jgi:hypothetical protein
MKRACLSDDPSCTGIVPCEACERMRRTQILPAAMVAAGFNGSPQVAKMFFDGYVQKHNTVVEGVQRAFEEEAAREEAMAPTVPAPVSIPEPPPLRVVPEPEPPPLTAGEVLNMGVVEDFDESDEPDRLTFSPKAARAYARKARKLKEKRASVNKKEDGHHGKDDKQEHDGGN